MAKCVLVSNTALVPSACYWRSGLGWLRLGGHFDLNRPRQTKQSVFCKRTFGRPPLQWPFIFVSTLWHCGPQHVASVLDLHARVALALEVLDVGSASGVLEQRRLQIVR